MRTAIIADVHASFHARDAYSMPGRFFELATSPPSASSPTNASSGCADVTRLASARKTMPSGADSPRPSPWWLASRAWTRSVLTLQNAAWLAALPSELKMVVSGRRMAMIRAYAGDDKRYSMATEDGLDHIARALPRAELIVTSHPRRQCVCRHSDKIVVNAGSVGQDAVPSTAPYAILDQGNIGFGTTRYDVQGRSPRFAEPPYLLTSGTHPPKTSRTATCIRTVGFQPHMLCPHE